MLQFRSGDYIRHIGRSTQTGYTPTAVNLFLVGIENRDYVRNDDSSGSYASFGAEFPVVRNLILVTALVYILQILLTRPINETDLKRPSLGFDESGQIVEDRVFDPTIESSGQFPKVSVVEQWLQLDTHKVLRQGQIWRILTSSFCHPRGHLIAILINMALLYWCGRELEMVYGGRSLLWIYLTGAIFSSLAFLVFQQFSAYSWPTIGSTGALMAVMMVYAMIHPRDQINVFFVLPIQVRFLLLFYVIYDLQPVLLHLGGTPQVASSASVSHLGGLLYGFVFWQTGWSLASLWDRTAGKFQKRKSSRQDRNPNRKLPVNHSMRPENRENKKLPANSRSRNIDQEVDRILAKISDSGKESLSAKELKTLEEASQRYSKRTDSS